MSPFALLEGDAHDERLRERTHPRAWKNPRPAARYNLVVLGAGTAGLVSAIGAAGLGAKVAIVERALTGGDCLNFGCVPSKGLIRAGRAAEEVRRAEAFGVRVPPGVEVDFAAAMERVRGLRADISVNDSVERMTSLGIDVFLGEARFVATDAVEVEGARLRFSRAVIATGARAAVPAIDGLAESGFLTNETVFTLTSLPPRLVVLGGGPIGCELAQTFARLGSAVTVIEQGPRLIPRDDPEASRRLTERLRREGIDVRVGTKVVRVARSGEVRRLETERGGVRDVLEADALLVAAGRAPNVEGLGLDVAGVRTGERGIAVDDHLRTSNPRIFAAGDVCGRFQFTHAADATARIALQNALFFGRKKASALSIPWCTYTDPEIAHVGVTADEALARGEEIVTHTVELSDNDRARLDARTEGFVRVHLRRKDGRVLGGTVMAAHAGELIGTLALSVSAGLRIGALGSVILPYPTQGEALKRIADLHARTRLTPTVKRLFERLMRWRR